MMKPSFQQKKCGFPSPPKGGILPLGSGMGLKFDLRSAQKKRVINTLLSMRKKRGIN